MKGRYSWGGREGGVRPGRTESESGVEEASRCQ